MELERSGVKIDACRQCRGVWLDRGELDQMIARERQVVAAAANDDEEFFREMSGEKPTKYGLNKQTADQLYRDYKAHRSHKSHKSHKKRKSFLDELFD
jgi:Zn-finger nucleic acid-binding protein